ncbi:MAG: exodeoxyribonuclease VII large subunit [Thermodesulfobacteriota bacterium]
MSIFRPIYTVSQLTNEIKNLLERNFEYIWVEGEISNLRIPTSGHIYFTLKDETAQIRAVMFRVQSRLLKFEPVDGLQVISYGRISVYEPRGEYQLIVDYLEPKGLGALQLAFEQLKEKLAQEGLFDPAHKKPIPRLPQRIGIITSPTGAAIRDMLKIIERRYANIYILIYPVRVQGPGAAQEIAQAIKELNEWPNIDVIIVGRGGGSLEDLWAFNEEIVARAIFSSRVPVISAVGHEIDYTIADFVADLRAPTPSAAAELVVQEKIELLEGLANLNNRLFHNFRSFLEIKKEKLQSFIYRLIDPRKKLSDQRLHIDDLSHRLFKALSQTLLKKKEIFQLKRDSLFLHHPGRQIGQASLHLQQLFRQMILAVKGEIRLLRQKWQNCSEKLNALNPLAILERGYSIAWLLPRDEIIKDASLLKAEDKVRIKVHKGEFTAKVEKITLGEKD